MFGRNDNPCGYDTLLITLLLGKRFNTLAISGHHSAFRDSRLTDFGVPIQDHEGYFLCGFCVNIDPSCNLLAEILALYHGRFVLVDWFSKGYLLFIFLACD